MHRLYAIFTLLLGFTGLESCVSQYNIDGNSTIAGIDGQKMYLRMTTGDKTQTICLDSCEIVHGTFRFGGAVDSVAMVDLYMGDDPMMPVVLENGELFVQMDHAAQSVSGGPLNERLNNFLTKQSKYENELWDINRRARYMLYEGKSLEQIVAAIDPLKSKILEQMRSLEVQFVKDNYENVLGPGYFMRMCNTPAESSFMGDAILDILENAPATFLAHPFIEKYLFSTGLTPNSLLEHRTSRRRAPIDTILRCNAASNCGTKMVVKPLKTSRKRRGAQ